MIEIEISEEIEAIIIGNLSLGIPVIETLRIYNVIDFS